MTWVGWGSSSSSVSRGPVDALPHASPGDDRAGPGARTRARQRGLSAVAGASAHAFSVPAGGRRRHCHLPGVPRRAQVRPGAPDAGNPALPAEALGPDAWLGDWDAAYLARRLEGRRAPLKAFLLDQRHLAGIGNIYADEILWWVGLSPLRPAGSLHAEEVLRLAAEIPRRLEEGVRRLGCTLSDFVDTDGKPGTFQENLRAYGRQGLPCSRCGAIMVRVVIAGRGTAYCPGCQR